MFLIFAGLGILGAVPLLLVWFLCGWLGAPLSLMAMVALVLSIGIYPLGIYLNKTRPARNLAARMDARSDQLHALADAGRFSRGPGFLPPTSMAEAHQQADAMAIEEYTALKDKVTNRNTLFWIPLQYWAIVSVAISAVLVAVGLR